jgi:hypothetical protein
MIVLRYIYSDGFTNRVNLAELFGRGHALIEHFSRLHGGIISINVPDENCIPEAALPTVVRAGAQAGVLTGAQAGIVAQIAQIGAPPGPEPGLDAQPPLQLSLLESPVPALIHPRVLTPF